MNPTANMGWGQAQAGQGPGNGGQVSVVATVWGVTTSTQSAPMGSQGYNPQMGNNYCGNSGSNGTSGYGGMKAGSGYGSTGGGTGRHMGPAYAGGGYVS